MPELEPLDCTEWVWRNKYALTPTEMRIEQTWQRIAAAAASAEGDRAHWTQAFFRQLRRFAFLPGGRILAGAGTDNSGTLCSCFVMAPFADSFRGLQRGIEQASRTMRAGGGTGFDLSSLRPAGDPGYDDNTLAPGPVAIARILDALCGATVTRSGRRGAMMATLRCDHPDIEQFIQAKHAPGELTHANLSVLITDAFMRAVDDDAQWPLVFPKDPSQPAAQTVYRSLNARELWQQLKRAAFDGGEPGVLFIDRINALNNLAGRETLISTNPCAEQPLPAYGACTLGSVNLPRFVHQPFTAQAQMDHAALRACVKDGVRLLDNIVDMARYPLALQAQTALHTRRIGLGFTGLADALAMLNLNYTDTPAQHAAQQIMAFISDAAYQASAHLAAEKGPYPSWEWQAFAASHRASLLSAGTLDLVRRWGLRNSHLTAVAPAGTISLLAGNVSSGIEPIFGPVVERNAHTRTGDVCRLVTQDYACFLWHRFAPGQPLPEQFVFADGLSPEHHLAMQAAVQPYVDAGIAKTINLAPETSFTAAGEIFDRAYALQLKGCTMFRAGLREPHFSCRA